MYSLKTSQCKAKIRCKEPREISMFMRKYMKGAKGYGKINGPFMYLLGDNYKDEGFLILVIILIP
jgi:hypothetical protein